jgi:hypothetical protein
MTAVPIYAISDTTHTFTWDDGTSLELRDPARDRTRRLWAEVLASAGPDALLNHKRFDLMDQVACDRFAAGCTALDGAIVWAPRLLYAAHHLADTLAQQEPIIPPVLAVAAPFPVEVFPPVLADFVTQGAAALPCPPDFLGVPLLAILGAAIGTSHVVEIKPGWRESARLWTAVVADPGSKKSPALDLVIQPLYRIQHRQKHDYGQRMAAYDVDRVEYEKLCIAWKRDKHATADTLPAKPEEPAFPQLFSTDATVEALAGVLEPNPRGVLFVRDELTAWARAMNQYKGGRGADRQTWLSFWNGATAVINRKSRKEPIVLEHPFVGVAGCLPPEVLGELTDERGREDGFVHRILFSCPAPCDITWTEAHIDQAMQDQYAAVVERLYALPGDTSDPETQRPRILQLTPAGKATFVEWAMAHYHELNAPDLSPMLRGPWAKFEGYCARLALVLHLTRLVCGEVQHEAIDDISVFSAAAMVDYCKSHARIVYAQLHASPEDKRVDAARQWIGRHGGEATVRDLYTYKVAGCATTHDAEALVELLVSQGYGTLTDEVPPTGGHRRKVFRVHR